MHPHPRSSRPASIRCSRRWSRGRSTACGASASCAPTAAGERLVATGEVSPGMFVILDGEVAITQHSVLGLRGGDRHPRAGIVHGRAEPALRPAVAGGRAGREAGRGARHSVGQAARRARRGSRARRAHHARPDPAPRRSPRERRRGSADRRPRRRRRRAAAGGIPRRATGSRTRRSIPTATPARRTLVERFHVEPSELPIVLCANGAAAAQSERGRAGALPRPRASDRSEAGLRRRHRRCRTGRPRRGRLRGVGRTLGRSCSIAAPSAARRARRRGSRTTWAFPPASPAWR